METQRMSISAFAKRSLLSVKALRLYDQMDLLKPEWIDPSSAYRYYSDSQLETARFISLCRRLAVPLALIRILITLPAPAARQQLEDWWKEEEERFESRRDLHRYIAGSVLGKESDVTSLESQYDIRIREQPAVCYLKETAFVTGPQLPDVIRQLEEQLSQRAASDGAVVEGCSVVFHGQVDLDSNGPIEVRVALGTTSSQRTDAFREEAHLQAGILLKRAQIAFPQILQVYRALRHWIPLNGYEISGPPRENYLASFDLASHEDHICEVAFPVKAIKGDTSE